MAESFIAFDGPTGQIETVVSSARLTLRIFHFLTARLSSAQPVIEIDETRLHNSRLGVC